MRKQRLFLLAIALLLIALSWWGVAAARSGLVVRSIRHNGVPMLYIAPQPSGKIPGVLIAHGFAGSKQLMLGYGQVLAHAGYAAMLWDFGGHGANPAPLEGFSLQKDLDIATAALLEQPEVDSTRLALLGHSMGSGAVMSAGIRDRNRFAATVAISPTGAAVTPFAPRNLQLQAGSWEGGFVNNAQQLLKKAGEENNNLSQGRGRKLVIVPNVEHITILFSDASHQAARRWLDATFGVQNNSNYVDRRMVWYGLHLLAWLILLAAIAPSLTLHSTQHEARVLPIKSYFGLLLAPLLASSVLPLISRVANIQNLGGLMVGGALGIWFFVAGTIWLIILLRVPRPTILAIGIGLLFFAILWMAFGAIAQIVWLQWWLIPARLKLVPLLSIACFPWFLASGISQQNADPVKRVAWWLLETTMLIGGLLLVLSLLPQLGFIFLVLPLFPPIMAILSFAASQVKETWSYAIGSAIFFGWTIASAFPLAA
ncbi:alpha/beta fold hydrolase [Argonema antarcticum]|uniref:alpha/beta fold hydrolase n=1 Tax=Argonema antarcticum TaxID=2942763 RepID=UPI002011F1BE|nr:alpha/beta fold hydrolase [Argonema antarcticum]